MFYLEEDTIVQSYQLGPQPVIGPPTILNSIAFLGAQVRSFCTNGSAAILQFSHVTQLPTIMVTLPPQACPTHPALVIYPYGHAAYMPVMSQPPIVRVFGTSLPCSAYMTERTTTIPMESLTRWCVGVCTIITRRR